MKKNRVGSYGNENIVFIPTAISGTTAMVSNPISIENLDIVGLQLVSTSTVAGAWTVQVSNDYAPSIGSLNQTESAGTWSQAAALFSPTIAAVISGGGSQYVQATLAASWFRVTFTPTSGAGNVAAYYSAKGAE